MISIKVLCAGPTVNGFIFCFSGLLCSKAGDLVYQMLFRLDVAELTLCLLGIFSHFLSSADFFQKFFFLKNSFRNTIKVSNSLDPDQAGHFVRPDLGPNCLQSLSADDTSRQRVNE